MRGVLKYVIAGMAVYWAIYAYLCLSNIMGGAKDAQIILAFISVPISVFADFLVRPFLDAYWSYGDPVRNFIEWVSLFLSGTIEYGVIGLLLRLALDSQRN